MSKPLLTLRLCLFTTLLLLPTLTWAQANRQLSQYMINPLALNPAAAGSRDVLGLTALYRAQWAMLADAPQTTLLLLDVPGARGRSGWGIQLYDERTGQRAESGGFVAYALRLPLGQRTTLALGVQAGAERVRGTLTDFLALPATRYDPSLEQRIERILPNVGAGLHLSNDWLYVSLSVPQLIRHTYGEGDNGAVRQLQTAYALVGTSIGLSQAVQLKPSMLLKYVTDQPVGADLNANLWLRNRVAVGASYRKNQFYNRFAGLSDAVVGLLAWQVSPQIRLGYAYDRTIRGPQRLAPSSHEVMLRYEFSRSTTRTVTPRYF